MNYIVFDLEWNQCPEGKEKMDKLLPFEIIEIGAVKLNSSMETVDEFSALIRPQVYKHIHFRTMEVIHINSMELKGGRPFREVAEDFFKWCGRLYTFCTWGSLDLSVLQKNLSYFGLDTLLIGPIIFYDIQKIFSIVFEDRKIRRNLEFAVDYLRIPKSKNFHRAYFDAYYTAEIIPYFHEDELEKNYSIDYYKNPKTKEEEIEVVYETYSKYISREFATKEDVMEDRQVTSSICYKCNGKAKKKFRWFSANNNIYYCLAYCDEHGFLKGKLRMKKTEEGKFFCVKTLKLIGYQEAESIKEKKDMVQLKRKLKRHTQAR